MFARWSDASYGRNSRSHTLVDMTSVASGVRSRAVWPVLCGVALLAGVTAAAIGAMTLADALTATGLPDPGPVTTYGLPFVRAAGEIACVVAVGSFMFAAFLVPPQQSGVLDADGYRALRIGTVASALWTVCAVLLVPLTVSDVTGQPLRPGSARWTSGRWPAWSKRRAHGGGRRSWRRSSRSRVSRCCAGRRRRCCSAER